ncbi:MAG: hypothetical protein Q8P10_03295 [bacterium]|nr:hypothetical protein [bacterium]
MIKSKKDDKNIINKKPASSNPLNSAEDDKLRILANLIIDRILEDKQLYINTLKKDQVFDPHEFRKFIKNKIKNREIK